MPRFAELCSAALVLSVTVPVLAQSVIVTAAGTDLVFGGAGQSAVSAPLGRVSRVTVDSKGRPVFSDPSYHLVFRVETDGSISVIAGNNVQGMSNISGYLSANTGAGGGYSGDEGSAIKAALNRPEGLAYDPAGNLYIADTFNQRIRKVDTQGTITTFAGNGKAGYKDSSQPLSASFNYPTDIAVDGNGNVYVNDFGNIVIRKITPQGVVSTVAGTVGVTGNAVENAPAASPLGDIEAITFDAQGNLYLADASNNNVRRIASGLITTVAGNGSAGFNGDGPALSVSLGSPRGLAFDPNGNLLISDTGNNRVRKLGSGIITTIAGTGQAGFSGDGGPASSATLHNPYGLAVSQGGAIYIADRDNFRIRSISSSGAISTAAGNGRLISSQNGIQPNLATLLDPYGVSFDSSGALLIADTDNNIIRRMNNANGTLTTIAGTGAAEESGDNGPATLAGLAGPFSVNTDPSGNYYEPDADFGSVRKIGTSGLISTIVANLSKPTQAVADSSGNIWISDLGNSRILRYAPDGSIAQLAISSPGGIAIDGLGNLYVTESYVPALGAGQVVKISPTFKVTTIAGGGSVAGTAADGGLATNAQLGNPAGIVVDAAGSVYFSDFSNANIRKVTLGGIISTVAGNGHSGFSGDGGPATSASLGEPWGLTLDAAGSLYVADVLNNRIRKVLLTSPPSFTVDQTSLAFTAASNSKITDPATLTLSSTLPGLLFSVSADQSWLTITPSGGAMPALVQVTADPTGLAASSSAYTGHVTITALGANPAAIIVTVSFTVGASGAAAIASDTNILSYAFVSGASPVTSQVSIRNSGSGSVSYSVSSPLNNGIGWMSVSPATGSATPNTPGLVTVTITSGQLAAGTYTGTLIITGAGNSGSVQIPVSVSVKAAAPKLQITQPGLTFPAIQGGGAPLPRTFSVYNAGTGSMNWTAAVTSNSPWLSVSPSSGTVVTPLTDFGNVSVKVSPAGLAPGTYYGLISVNSPGSSLQTVAVAVNVAAVFPNFAPKGFSSADVYPGGLLFTQSAGTSPSSQTVSIANLNSAPITYTSSRLVTSGQPWFVQVPATGSISPGQTATIVVQPDFSNLQAGSYQGSIALQFSDGSNTTVNLQASVLGPTASAVGASAELKSEAANCGTTIAIGLSAPQQPMKVTLNQGVALEVNLSNACGPITGAINSAAASITPSNNDQSFDLRSDPTRPGTWTGNWTPIHNTSNGQITLHIFADTPAGGSDMDFTATITPPVSAAATAPEVTPAAIVNAASFASGLPVSPGALITIYGNNLSDGTASQGLPPLQTTLRNAQILLGGQALPLLYVSTGQVNAQIPPDLPVNTQHQIQVQRDGVPSVGAQVNVADATPAIFATAQNGLGQGAITNAVTGVLADSSNPVTAGQFVSIYCTGLGVVSPAVPAGQPASSDPLSYAVNTVTATIGGKPAMVQFAGLAPNYAGLYQVNALVPDGLTPGDQPVVITVANQSSPPVLVSSPPVTVAVK